MLCARHLGLLLVHSVTGRIAGVLLLSLGMMLLVNDARRSVQLVRRSLAGVLLLRVVRVML